MHTMALRQKLGIICLALHLLISTFGVHGIADQSEGKIASKAIPENIDPLRISHKPPGSILELHRSHRLRRQHHCNVFDAKPTVYRRTLGLSADPIN